MAVAGSMKKVQIIGNLAADPEMKFLPDGTPVCSYRVLVNNRRRGAAGAGGPEEPPTGFRITAWRRQAEVANELLKKGMSIYVDGELSTSEYTNNEGKTRFNLEVTQDTMQILTPKGMVEGSEYGGQSSGGGSYGGNQGGAQGGGNQGGGRPSGGQSYGGNRQPAPAAQPAPSSGDNFEDDGDIPF